MKGLFVFSNIFWSLSNFLIKRYGHTDDPKDLTIEVVRTFLIKTAVTLLSVIVASLGVLTILVDLILSSFRQQQLLVSDITAVGAFLIFAAALTSYFVFKKDTWDQPIYRPQPRNTLSQAFAALINEFVERKRYERDRLLNTSHQPGGFV